MYEILQPHGSLGSTYMNNGGGPQSCSGTPARQVPQSALEACQTHWERQRFRELAGLTRAKKLSWGSGSGLVCTDLAWAALSIQKPSRNRSQHRNKQRKLTRQACRVSLLMICGQQQDLVRSVV